MLRQTLPLLFLLALGACATTPGDSEGETAATSGEASAFVGRIVGRGVATGASSAVATASAIESARSDLARKVESRIRSLAATLRDDVLDLDDPEAMRRFENARHLAAAETLRAAPPPQVGTYLEASGYSSATARVSVDDDEPALRLYEQLRRIERFEDRLAGEPDWQALAERAAARRLERAEPPPLPPVGGTVEI